jgi:hypothetical protein
VNDQLPADWKVRLKYGRLSTQFKHYSVIASGVVGALREGFSCRPGKAFMGMKVWASSADDATDMVIVIGGEIGFRVAGKVEVYETEPMEPPRERPHGYDIDFTPCGEA